MQILKAKLSRLLQDCSIQHEQRLCELNACAMLDDEWLELQLMHAPLAKQVVLRRKGDRLNNEQCPEGVKVQVVQGILQQGVSLQLH